jgi:DNA repair ATPase RecN|tara:strand:+ start:5312 stop:6568 length:1257 start_codon:yes stop_codon:yes gene_type:complete
MSDHCKIVELRASNVKRIKAVTIRPDPDGNMVVISGDNGHGKSSILDAISMLFGGKDQMPSTPVRVGEDIAEIVADLGDMVVTRRISSKGHTTLKVQNREGATFSSPQQMLNALTGKLAFDPLSFSRMKAKEQAELLRELLGLDFLEQLRERGVHYDKRTEVNRSIKLIEGEVASMPRAPDDLLPRVAVSELLIELKAAENANRLARAASDQVADAHREGVRLGEQVRRDRELLKVLEAKSESVLHDYNKLKETADAMVTVDTEPITTQIAGAEAINTLHQKEAERERATVRLQAAARCREELTEKIKAIDQARVKAIAEAEMPVPGLGFNDDGLVTLNDLPIDQASAAEQLRVSVAIGIAMNPKLRVLLVRDASLLDDTSMAKVAQQAKDSDCQLWVERIEVDSNTTVIIEEGELKE